VSTSKSHLPEKATASKEKAREWGVHTTCDWVCTHNTGCAHTTRRINGMITWNTSKVKLKIDNQSKREDFFSDMVLT